MEKKYTLLPFACHCRVQHSLLEELLDCGIMHVWFAFACLNWALHKFHAVCVGGQWWLGPARLPACQAEFYL